MKYWSSQRIIRTQIRVKDQTRNDWLVEYEQRSRRKYQTSMEEKIGGPKAIVEIDHAMLYVQKHHVGRVMRRNFWTSGGTFRDTRSPFAVPVVKRGRITLSRTVEQRALEKSHIMTDGWAAYGDLGFGNHTHSTVKSKKSFKEPKTGSCPSVNANMWCWLKASLFSTGTLRSKNRNHLWQILWRSRSKNARTYSWILWRSLKFVSSFMSGFYGCLVNGRK